MAAKRRRLRKKPAAAVDGDKSGNGGKSSNGDKSGKGGKSSNGGKSGDGGNVGSGGKTGKGGRVLSDSRNCVHSRAYKKAASVAKKAGLSHAQISAAACRAGKEATARWDIEHA